MTKEEMDLIEKALKMRADYQFGEGAGDALTSRGLKVEPSKRTGKPRYVYDSSGRLLATVRWSDGLMALSLEGARCLHEYFKPPRLRVIVAGEAVSFVKKGRSVFAKHVMDVDPEIRSGDEVIIVDKDDRLLAVGRAVLSSLEMRSFDAGIAVKVRRGIDDDGGKPERTT
ncbi:MAG: pseudouridine synthase [Candidatus Nezhaarchaeota archaeon]|nr:pseudouridine synthase [Candidatus Nezhaarchaeota archaeon]